MNTSIPNMVLDPILDIQGQSQQVDESNEMIVVEATALTINFAPAVAVEVKQQLNKLNDNLTSTSATKAA